MKDLESNLEIDVIASVAKQPSFQILTMERHYYVYIMTNLGQNVLYTGVTNDLGRRVYEHRRCQTNGFTKRYQVNKLVYFEVHSDVQEALAREKKIKGGSRKKKMELIESVNGYWLDLSVKLGLEES